MSLDNQQHQLGISNDTVSKRAYEIWESRGRPQGDGSENWQLAQKQLLAEARRRQRPIVRLLNRLRNRAAM